MASVRRHSLSFVTHVSRPAAETSLGEGVIWEASGENLEPVSHVESIRAQIAWLRLLSPTTDAKMLFQPNSDRARVSKQAVISDDIKMRSPDWRDHKLSGLRRVNTSKDPKTRSNKRTRRLLKTL